MTKKTKKADPKKAARPKGTIEQRLANKHVKELLGLQDKRQIAENVIRGCADREGKLITTLTALEGLTGLTFIPTTYAAKARRTPMAQVTSIVKSGGMVTIAEAAAKAVKLKIWPDADEAQVKNRVRRLFSTMIDNGHLKKVYCSQAGCDKFGV